jgi:predicted DsbA family dithiol-disulfide isomerase
MVTIDVFADIACPWCYVGERRMKRALEARGLRATVRWRPYELQRGLPREGIPWSELVERKFGGWERARTMFQHVQDAGTEEGIRFDFERVASAPNSRDAHRVMLLAQEKGRLWEAAEALFAAYFTEGRDVGSIDVLAEVAGSAGVDADEVREMLAGARFVAEVEASEEAAEAGGMNSVPYFVFNGRFALSGAQPMEVFEMALDRATGIPAS